VVVVVITGAAVVVVVITGAAVVVVVVGATVVVVVVGARVVVVVGATVVVVVVVVGAAVVVVVGTINAGMTQVNPVAESTEILNLVPGKAGTILYWKYPVIIASAEGLELFIVYLTA
jgi:hypothetical protein